MRHNREELSKLTVEELVDKCAEQDAYIESLLSKIASRDEGGTSREVDDKLKQQQQEAARRENVLYMKLTTKEQELQDCMKQIQELQQAQTPTAERLRAMLLDPAVSLLFRRMKKEVESLREKLDQAQNDLAASKFTPDSQTGKRLMAKCRMLLQENEELGKVISTGRTARLEGEIALQKKLAQEMKKTQTDTEEFLSELDEEVEGMQSAIYLLQQQLREAHDHSTQLQAENDQLKCLVADLTAKTNGDGRTLAKGASVIDNNNHHASVDVSSGSGSVATATGGVSGQSAAVVETVVVVNAKPQDQQSVAKQTVVVAGNSNERTSQIELPAEGADLTRTTVGDNVLNAIPAERVAKGHTQLDSKSSSSIGSKCDERNGETHSRTKEAKDLSSTKAGFEEGISSHRMREGVGLMPEGEFRTKDSQATSDGNGLNDSKVDVTAPISDSDDKRRGKQTNKHDSSEVSIRTDRDDSIDHSQSSQREVLTPKSEKNQHKSKDSGSADKKRRTKEEPMDTISSSAEEQNDHSKGKNDDLTESPQKAHRTKRTKKEKDSPEAELQHKRKKLRRTGSKGGEDMINGLTGLGGDSSSNDNM